MARSTRWVAAVVAAVLAAPFSAAPALSAPAPGGSAGAVITWNTHAEKAI
jgi:hypothetical protein